MAPRVLMSLWD